MSLCALHSEVIADTVEDDDSVVHAVTENGEKRRDKQRIDLEVGEVAQNDEDTDGHHHVMKERNDRNDSEFRALVLAWNVTECESEIQDNTDGCGQNGIGSTMFEAFPTVGPMVVYCNALQQHRDLLSKRCQSFIAHRRLDSWYE